MADKPEVRNIAVTVDSKAALNERSWRVRNCIKTVANPGVYGALTPGREKMIVARVMAKVRVRDLTAIRGVLTLLAQEAAEAKAMQRETQLATSISR